jgi:hypothetical protein
MGGSRCSESAATTDGGFDALVVKAKPNVLSRRVLGIKRAVEKKAAEPWRRRALKSRVAGSKTRPLLF